MIDATSSPVSASPATATPRAKAKRLDVLPRNVFATIEELKANLLERRCDVIDLGFGNPDLPASPLAVARLAEAAADPSTHRYSPARGLIEARKALSSYYQQQFGVEVDAEREVLVTVGSTEALAHLLWALADHGDPIVLPTPYYPPHWAGVALAGAKVISVAAAAAIASISEIVPTVRPQVVLVSFPQNPTTTIAS